MRHVVTSLSAAKIIPSLLYTAQYCPRGEMENRIKEQQLDLFADRTSTQSFESNQLRRKVIFHGLCFNASFSTKLFK